jgi:hypothetical protein
VKPAREPLCPACGGANACAVAATGRFDTPCWCSSVVIDPAVIEKLPEQQRGKACLCARCAGAIAATTQPGTTK